MANENFKVNQPGETGKNVLKLTENQTVAEFHFSQAGNPLLINTFLIEVT